MDRPTDDEVRRLKQAVAEGRVPRRAVPVSDVPAENGGRIDPSAVFEGWKPDDSYVISKADLDKLGALRELLAPITITPAVRDQYRALANQQEDRSGR